jgi:two-component system sensor histidine kinase YesM
MKKKTHTFSLAFRLSTSVILGMVLLNALTIYSTYQLGTFAEYGILREYRQVQVLYANEIEREMNQAQTRITDVSNAYMTAMAMSASALEDERQYEALRCRTELTIAMRSWQIHFPMITGYYVYGSEIDVLVYQGDGLVGQQWFASQLKNNNEGSVPELSKQGGWQLLDTPMGDILLFNLSRRNTYHGTWIQVDKLWRTLSLNTNNSEHLYSIVRNDVPLPTGTYIDVPIGTTGYLLRQILPKSATSLPQSITILQYLAYFMLLVLPISWFSLRRLVFKPLKEVTKAIEQINEGNTDYRIPEKTTSSEFNQLNHQFNHSVEMIAQARMQVYESQLENERIRINYLTQQMQPHFVLNTLNLVYSMEPSQYELMQNTIQCLARYFRYIAHISEPLVPVEAELEHVKNYFRLQQIRYPNNFDFCVQCPEELLEMLIPPIVIQTFAENAIKHSLTIGEKNHVDVRIDKTTDEHLHIIIYDSGAGFPKEVLEKIRMFQTTRIKQDGLGLGIQNTIERISLIYDCETELQFSNAAKGGAQIDIYLPIRENPRHREKS